MTYSNNGLVAKLVPTSISDAIRMLLLALLLNRLYSWGCNILFHKLSKFPGPWYAGMSRGPAIYHQLKGDYATWVLDLHETYGECVRFSPNELSFSGAEAHRDMYGHKACGPNGLVKHPKFYKPLRADSVAILSADYDNHSRMRRIFSHAFSDRALKLQEPMFLMYVDKLIAKMRASTRADPDRKHDYIKLLNCTTFDIMGDLTFGESLQMLDNDEYHPWVAMIFESIRIGAIMQVIRYFPFIEHIISNNMPKKAMEGMIEHQRFSRERVDRRLARKDARPDIWGLVLQKDGSGAGLTKKEMYSNAGVFMVAGTETTATLLSGLTYYMLKNPATMAKLVREIRTTFATESDMTYERLQAMKYLHACLEEGLRMYPPVPVGLPRRTPEGPPTIIDGHEIPGGVCVAATHLATNRNPNNFRDPYKFDPERWRRDSEYYANDKKQAFQPFSLGPRGCLGKNMAYHEMRLILVKVLYNFDLSLCEESDDWANQKTFTLWDKPELMAHISFQL
ncbi:hypothetical protein FOXB_17742 [Fusarium oxysporum f. sp. conglutinans Fo5176]|uniref:Uncharacterized protein n=1 Tax=Fusarium oxysporum (strain Fo5176) TaxID=660025 RepID=F9GGF8_FUSOF|nr:hypothetical protein FOXB_17742 [Fusarium oxysporum f. sp. conglutinans Fo5176]